MVTDVGVGADEDAAYPHVAVAAARLVAEGKADRPCWSARTGTSLRCVLMIDNRNALGARVTLIAAALR